MEKSRVKQVKTMRRRYGQKWYKKNSAKAGRASPTKFDSDRGRAAAKARWDKWRKDQAKKLKENK